MKVLQIIEHDDGSATIEFDTTSEETKMLIEYALKDIITKQVLKDIENAAKKNSNASDDNHLYAGIGRSTITR